MAGFKSYYRGPMLNIGVRIQLDKGEAHHLVGVLRARNGDKVTLFNGLGGVWEGIIDISSKNAFLTVISELNIEKPKCNLILAQSLSKGKGMDEILQKATEIGVAKIIPLKTDRTELKLDAERETKRMERWRTIVIEACKQSGNFFIPEIVEIQRIKNFLRECFFMENTLKLTASLEVGAKLLNNYFLREFELPSSIIWLIGPEGDFTSREYKLAFECGFKPISLSRNVLRVETAAIYALSITDYEINSRLGNAQLENF